MHHLEIISNLQQRCKKKKKHIQRSTIRSSPGSFVVNRLPHLLYRLDLLSQHLGVHCIPLGPLPLNNLFPKKKDRFSHNNRTILIFSKFNSNSMLLFHLSSIFQFCHTDPIIPFMEFACLPV